MTWSVRGEEGEDRGVLVLMLPPRPAGYPGNTKSCKQKAGGRAGRGHAEPGPFIGASVMQRHCCWGRRQREDGETGLLVM